MSGHGDHGTNTDLNEVQKQVVERLRQEQKEHGDVVTMLGGIQSEDDLDRSGKPLPFGFVVTEGYLKERYPELAYGQIREAMYAFVRNPVEDPKQSVGLLSVQVAYVGERVDSWNVKRLLRDAGYFARDVDAKTVEVPLRDDPTDSDVFAAVDDLNEPPF